MPTKIEKDAITGTETTGHEWDGVRELNTPLPKWWVYTFYATIAFSAGYMLLYPSVPGIGSHFEGLLGYTNRQALSEDVKAAEGQQAAYRDRVSAASLGEIRKDPQLFAFAMTGGKAVFNENCAACHKAGGAGGKGFPNLADDKWLWGGTLNDIHQTIAHGIRNADPDSRQSAMPRFGADGILTAAQIGDVADYVISLSSKSTVAPPAALERGAKLFAENCAACHGADGKGNREVGAPRLTDRIWLYGGDKASVVQTITFARNGSMPAWSPRLDDATIKMLAVYVHALGGGE
jgi:cytochrome c oxidase cbb3-type subunit 3